MFVICLMKINLIANYAMLYLIIPNKDSKNPINELSQIMMYARLCR